MTGDAPRSVSPIRVAVLTVSDSVARGERTDRSGELCAMWAHERGLPPVVRAVVADDGVAIARMLIGWCDSGALDLVLTTGGTGLARRDVTPEATRSVIEREAPGIAERMRMLYITSFPRAALSRGIAGVRGRTLIVNLPGSPGGVNDALAALGPIVDHACDILADRPSGHPDEEASGAVGDAGGSG